MKKKMLSRNRIATYITILLTSMGCTEEGSPQITETGTIPIRLQTNAPILPVRSVSPATDSFGESDVIGLYVVRQPDKWTENSYLCNEKFIFSDDGFIAETPVFYPAGNSLCDFLVYFPYQENTFSEDNPTMKVGIETDQQTLAALRQSDFMTGIKENITPSNEPVSIELTRKFAGITILLNPGNVFKDAETLLEASPSVKIRNCHTLAEYNVEKNELTDLSVISDIIPYSDLSFTEEEVTGISAILIPQQLEAGKTFIEVTVEGRKYGFAFEEEHTFSPNIREVLTLTLSGKDSIGVIDAEITDWEDENTHTGNLQEVISTPIELEKMDFNLSAIWRIYHLEQPVAEVCREYLLSSKINQVAVVFYPIIESDVNPTEGTVLWFPDNEEEDTGGTVKWTTENRLDYEKGSGSAITSFYLNKDGNITPDDEGALYTEVRPYLVKDRENNQYGTVKIGTQYWMNRNFRGTTDNQGVGMNQAENELGAAKATYRIMSGYPPEQYGCFYNWAAISSDILPVGWRMAVTDDWTRVKNYTGGTHPLKDPENWNNVDYGKSGLGIFLSTFILSDGTSGSDAEPGAFFWSAENLRVGIIEDDQLKGKQCTTDHGYNIRCIRK